MKATIAVLLSIFSIGAYAAVPLHRDAIEHLVTELTALHDAGVKIHQAYDLSNLDQLRQCVAKYGHLRTKAKSLRKEAQALSRLAYRANLTVAADNAFTCVYCGGSGSDCQKIPPALQTVEKYLSNEK